MHGRADIMTDCTEAHDFKMHTSDHVGLQVGMWELTARSLSLGQITCYSYIGPELLNSAASRAQEVLIWEVDQPSHSGQIPPPVPSS